MEASVGLPPITKSRETLLFCDVETHERRESRWLRDAENTAGLR